MFGTMAYTVASPAAGAGPAGWGHPRLVALCACLLPLAAGLLAGLCAWLALDRRLKGWGAAAAILVVPTVIPFLLPYRLARIGLWDWVLAGFLAGIGFLAASHEIAGRRRAGSLALFLGVSLACGLLLEGAVRVMGIPGSMPLPEEQHFFLGTDTRVMLRIPHLDASLLEPDSSPVFAERAGGLDPARPVVLHVGDSMVEGSYVRPEETFVAMLGRKDGARNHVNGGIAGTAPDFYSLLAQAWGERLGADGVVVYLFPGNDLADLDFPNAVSGGGPLLDYSDFPPRRSPERPSPGGPSRWLDPPPFVLRVAAQDSMLARRLVLEHSELVLDAMRVGRPVARDHFRKVMAGLEQALASRGTSLAVVILPLRYALEDGWFARMGSRAAERDAEDMANACRDLGIPVLDSRPVFAAEVRRVGVDALFVNDPPHDPHLGPPGHVLLADWLAASGGFASGAAGTGTPP